PALARDDLAQVPRRRVARSGLELVLGVEVEDPDARLSVHGAHRVLRLVESSARPGGAIERQTAQQRGRQRRGQRVAPAPVLERRTRPALEPAPREGHVLDLVLADALENARSGLVTRVSEPRGEARAVLEVRALEAEAEQGHEG